MTQKNKQSSIHKKVTTPVFTNTKGQVTLFVIIGVVLFLGALLFFMINSSLQMNKPNLDIPDVSLEARPANEIVTSCLSTVAEQAMRKIGSQGGTLHPPTVRYPPYRSEAVDFQPDIVQYWRSLDDCPQNPSGCENVFEPPLCRPTNKLCSDMPRGDNSIQQSVEEYIEEKYAAELHPCKICGEPTTGKICKACELKLRYESMSKGAQ
jgi:hypothetical protein